MIETFSYDPGRVDSPLGEGATDVWLYLHQGIGPAMAIRAVALTDADGHGFVTTEGEWQKVTVVDDCTDCEASQ